MQVEPDYSTNDQGLPGGKLSAMWYVHRLESKPELDSVGWSEQSAMWRGYHAQEEELFEE